MTRKIIAVKNRTTVNWLLKKKKKDARTKAEKKFMFEQNSDPQPSRT